MALSSPNGERAIEFMLNHFEIDDMRVGASKPVLMQPSDTGYSSFCARTRRERLRKELKKAARKRKKSSAKAGEGASLESDEDLGISTLSDYGANVEPFVSVVIETLAGGGDSYMFK